MNVQSTQNLTENKLTSQKSFDADLFVDEITKIRALMLEQDNEALEKYAGRPSQ